MKILTVSLLISGAFAVAAQAVEISFDQGVQLAELKPAAEAPKTPKPRVQAAPSPFAHVAQQAVLTTPKFAAAQPAGLTCCTAESFVNSAICSVLLDRSACLSNSRFGCYWRC